MSLLAMLAAAATAQAPSGSYDCSAQDMAAVFKMGETVRAANKLQLKNEYPYQKARVSFLPGNRVAIDLPANSLNLSGDYYLQATKEGIVSWSASSVAYCGLLDAECAPSAAFLATGDAGGSLTITAPTIVTIGDAKQVGTFQLFYKCERAA